MRRRVPPRLKRSLTVCVPVAALLIASGAGNASAARVPVNAPAAALASLRHLMIGEHGTDHSHGGRAISAGFGPKKVTSGNWSGYADGGDRTYSYAAARWKEPTATCTSTDSMAAFWVGIDGYGSDSVEQDGTLAYCYNGSPFYYTWWEMDPKNAMQIVSSAVQPGDEITSSVTASVASTYTRYTLRVTDFTHRANSFTKYQTCAKNAKNTCLNASAEWVAEAPASSSGTQYPLAKYSTWKVSAAAVKSGTSPGTILTFPAYEITMTGGSKVLAQPGRLNPAGTYFADTWKASTG